LTHPFFFYCNYGSQSNSKVLPQLISAVAACVQGVSDHCFSEDLIEETIHEKVTESVGTDKEKARTLILAIRTSVARNPNCFNVFMNVLENVLPSVNGPFLKAIKDAVTSEVEPPPKLISSDSDTCQLQPISDRKSDFVHNCGHHDEEPEESDSVHVTSVVMSVISEGATCISDTPKTALESSESFHSQVAGPVAMITSKSADDHIGTLIQNLSVHPQDEEAVEGAVHSKMTQTSTDVDGNHESSATQVQGEYHDQVESNQDVEVSCSACMCSN
jgi:hypothetical protein